MNAILKLALVATLAIFAQNVQAQQNDNEVKKKDKPAKSLYTPEESKVKFEEDRKRKLVYLKERRAVVEIYWKSLLKAWVSHIVKESTELGRSDEEIEILKIEAAQEIALNLQNHLAIIDNEIALVERIGSVDHLSFSERKWSVDHNKIIGSYLNIGFGDVDSNGDRVLGIAYKSNKSESDKSVKVQYDKRTYGETVVAFGLNNAITETGELGNDFFIGKSRFFELGKAWKTRVFENSGALHLKYGLSLQINKLFVKDNQTLVRGDETSSFQEFPLELRKSQLRFTNLVVPVHLEFGGWKKEEKEDYVRYKTAGKFRMGVGGYAGVRLGTQQKLKFREDGERVKTKEKQDFGGDSFVYGLSSYIRLTGDLSVYGKYDLSTILNTENLGDVNSISLGFQLEL